MKDKKIIDYTDNYRGAELYTTKTGRLKRVYRSATLPQKILLLLVTIAWICSLYYMYNWWQDGQKIKNIEISKGTITEQVLETESITKAPTENIADFYKFLDVDFDELKTKNPDTVGWLKINNIKVDYPIVQSPDNEYYLTHDYNKASNGAGWLFLDYRNSLSSMEFNRVIYGHNRSERIMFGALKGLLEEETAGKEDTKYINFNSPYGAMVYEICAVYVTNYEDWLYADVNLRTPEEKQYFVDNLKAKNQVKAFSNVNVSPTDSFLTLSTCHGRIGTTNRLVVHAKLVAVR